MTDPIVLRNRFAMVKGAWEEQLRGVPFPSLGEGTAEQKIERLELALVDEMRRRATPETAEQVADAMWGIVHARPEDDPVKLRVTRHHEELAKPDIGWGSWLFLHVVDTVSLVHAMILRLQALVMPIKLLVFGGH